MTLRGNLEAHVFSAIKVLTARMVQDCGKYEGVGMLLGRRPSQLHDWGNITMPACIPADVLLTRNGAVSGLPSLSKSRARTSRAGPVCPLASTYATTNRPS